MNLGAPRSSRYSHGAAGALALSFLRFVAFPVLAFGLGFLAAQQHAQRAQLAADSAPQLVDRDASVFSGQLGTLDLSLLRSVLSFVEKEYFDPQSLGEADLSFGVARGLVGALGDPYSELLSPEQTEKLEGELRSELEGIGAELEARAGQIVVVSPLRGSPAERAGLRPGDVITSVDGEKASGEGLFTVVERIRGQRGTPVVLGIFRAEEGALEVEITRDLVRYETVTLDFLSPEEGTAPDIAMLEIAAFGDRAPEEFSKKLDELLAQESVQGIVLDLRYNSGGYLDVAVAVLSAFLEEGTKLVVEAGRPPKSTIKFAEGGYRTGLPMVVLQNRGSASASEIVAGAIQGHKRGIIVGERSFGKGTVQELFPLEDGNRLRLTIARWLTPADVDVTEAGGLEPDIAVPFTQEDFENGRDPQLEAALRYLRGESAESLVAEFAAAAAAEQDEDADAGGESPEQTEQEKEAAPALPEGE